MRTKNEEVKLLLNLKKNRLGGGGDRQDGCGRRSEAFVKIQNKLWGGGRVGFRVDVNREVNLLCVWGGGGGVRVNAYEEVKLL